MVHPSRFQVQACDNAERRGGAPRRARAGADEEPDEQRGVHGRGAPVGDAVESPGGPPGGQDSGTETLRIVRWEGFDSYQRCLEDAACAENYTMRSELAGLRVFAV